MGTPNYDAMRRNDIIGWIVFITVLVAVIVGTIALFIHINNVNERNCQKLGSNWHHVDARYIDCVNQKGEGRYFPTK